MAIKSIIPKPIAEYDLRLLRIFVSVVEQGGFTAAENVLGITRSTISIHMTNLETRMKLKLCLRGRGGFSLTKDGQAVYRAVINLFESLNDFSLFIGTLSKELSGELVILCSELLDQKRQEKLAQVIEIVHDRSPNLHIALDGDSVSNIEKLLLKDKAHMGILPVYQAVEGLSYRPFSSELIYLCCAKKHPFFDMSDSQISPDKLASVSTIHPGIDIQSDGREQLQKLNLNAKSYQFDMRKAMILSGKYLGYMPQSHIQTELDGGEIRIIQPSKLSYNFDLSLVSKKTPRESAKVALLQSAFSTAFVLQSK